MLHSLQKPHMVPKKAHILRKFHVQCFCAFHITLIYMPIYIINNTKLPSKDKIWEPLFTINPFSCMTLFLRNEQQSCVSDNLIGWPFKWSYHIWSNLLILIVSSRVQTKTNCQIIIQSYIYIVIFNCNLINQIFCFYLELREQDFE